MNTRTVNDLLDIEWHIAVTEQLATNPHGIAFAVEPALLGQFCAERGEPCEPLRYGYTRPADVEAFCIAWHDTVALWAEMIGKKNDEARFDYDGALLELTDAIEDEEWIRRGC